MGNGASGAVDDGNADVGGTRAAPTPFERVVCPRCVRRAGGETSDFGDGSAFLSGGSGQSREPTACELSNQPSTIDLDAARELGFGRVLDQMATPFDQSFAWTAQGLGGQGRAATGYAPSSRLRGTVEIGAIEHLVPSLDGCEDSLSVRLATTLSTEDGALAIAGQLHALVSRSTRAPFAHALLELADARGTLEIFPPDTEAPVVGYVKTSMHFWPGEVRVDLHIIVIDPEDIGSDTPGPAYAPLAGRAPVDDCPSSDQKSLELDEPTPTLGGLSFGEHYSQILDWLGPQPAPGSWSTGGSTMVTTELGDPFAICEWQSQVGYQVPLRISSADGRVNLELEARGLMASEEGAVIHSSISDQRFYSEPVEGFAARTGISGVDFGSFDRAKWYAYVQGLRDAREGRRGAVGVETEYTVTDSDTGSTHAETLILDELTW